MDTPCPTCCGYGSLVDHEASIDVHDANADTEFLPCEACQGTGVVKGSACVPCKDSANEKVGL